MPEQPPYLRIADLLRARIASGEWEVGEKLPSRARLAEEYGVGPAIVRRANNVLIAEGHLEGRTGSGTYVAQPRARIRMMRSPIREQQGGSPFRANMAALGKQGTWESHTEAKAPVPTDIAARLDIDEGALGVHTRYEFMADGKPVQLSTSWEPYDLTSRTIVLLPEGGPHAGRGVVERMAEIGVTVTHAVERPEPRLATAEELALLSLPRGALVTQIQRTYYSDEGRPVETADIVVPAALCELVYEIPVSRTDCATPI
ncbi:GntR family transcriptional regulator [Streptomyces sp. WMMB 322]|uniref:GntR family transcriptional regulator n=1 Tax=Streptomyces sp. WMMB 322 TaxID=1286821 RepID=UPI0006E12D74|nr:GntR family transcriptional regulator [Streptomyces sp. WMMB 322]SCK12738.1 transcriptional regulator, GntR family [Streptomyces sp. WMMB 322]